MRRFEVRLSLADPSVTPFKLPPLELWQRAVDPNKEHIEVAEQAQESTHPGIRLNDVLDDEVVASCGKSGEAAVKSLEELGSQIAPRELTAVNAPLRQDIRGKQVINGEVPERFVECGLQATGKCGFARAGCPV
jgi:hypothetical protein